MKTDCNVKKYRLGKDVYMIRVDDNITRFFEGIWEIPEGITYNSYIVFGEEHIAVLDTVKEFYAECFLEAVKEIVELKNIDYIIVHHSEPDHSGALPKLLANTGNVTVVAHPVAKAYIESRYGISLGKRFTAAVKSLHVRLGGDTYLEVIPVPWLHWPDTIMTLLQPSKVLFSGDAFGAYSIPETITDDELSSLNMYERFMRKYFATVIGRYRNWVVKALDALRNYEFKVIAPLHGLVLKRYVAKVIELYQRWGQGIPVKGKALAICFTMYGLMEKACKTAVEELKQKYDVQMFCYNDRSHPPLSEIVGEAIDAELIVICTPTYEADLHPLTRHVVETLCSKSLTSSQRLFIISSYGWGGAVSKKLTQALATEKCSVRLTGIVESKGATVVEQIRPQLAKLVEG